MIENQMKKDYESGDSIPIIAKEYGWSESKVSRTFKKMGVKIRSRSESTKLALETGRATNPTKGKTHSKEAKELMSKRRAETWEKGGEEAKKKLSEKAKENWAKKSDFEKTNMLSKAGQALRRVADEGSAAEKFLVEKLRAHGYEVEYHNKKIVYGDFEIDILLPKEGIVIEIDGPHHFSPIFGEDRLARTQEMDQIKNGVLISKGLKVLRIKYVAKKFNNSVGRKMWEAVENALNGEIEKIKYIEF